MQLAPVDQAPMVVAEIDPLAGVTTPAPLVAGTATVPGATETALAEADALLGPATICAASFQTPAVSSIGIPALRFLWTWKARMRGFSF